MAETPIAELERRLIELHDRATALAERWAASAAGYRTAGQERALLRVLGVSGVDAAGRPLAAEVVDRFLAGGPNRLAGGIILPFAVALLEYDVAPQALALDVASGAVDLALEGELLDVPERRAAAEAEARRIVAGGVERIDANRVARRELLDVLGDPPRPWVGTSITEPVAQEAAVEARAAIRDGADLLRVDVPSGRELTLRLHALGVAVRPWEPGSRFVPASPNAAQPDPTGSQRGLRALRAVVDSAAAERPGYVRLATTTPALSAPESALVAAIERIDLVESDPIDEIVTVGVDPDRALADHGFARRVLRRAGASILIGAGPLVVGPDLARGVPSDPAARAGRALALQLLGVRLAVAQGMAPEQVFVGAVPAWLLGEPQPVARAAAEIVLRRVLLPECPLAFSEPGDPAAAAWPYLLGAALPPAPAGAMVLRAPMPGRFAASATGTRAAAAVAAEMAQILEPRGIQGSALMHARGAVAVASEMLDQVESRGWASVVGQGMGAAVDGADWIGRGPASVTPSRAAFDPLADLLAEAKPGAA